MSEEILQALMELFALISKQDEGTKTGERDYVMSFLRGQLSVENCALYIQLFDKHASVEKPTEAEGEKKKKRTGRISMLDSVKTLRVCEKINETLVVKQKIIVVVRLYELLAVENSFTRSKLELINTVGEVFNLSREIVKIEFFIRNNNIIEFADSNILIVGPSDKEVHHRCKFINSKDLDSHLLMLRIKNENLFFVRYMGSDELLLNGLPMKPMRIYPFANGSTIRIPKGNPIFYSDIASRFLKDEENINISFVASEVQYEFSKGKIGLHTFGFSESEGRLIGLMGASGAGKTTMLNTLSGNLLPKKGKIEINGIDLFSKDKRLDGVIGYVPQDDLLIEELSVFDNLFYNARLCFKSMSKDELEARVEKTLNSLGLLEIKTLKVGSPLNKTISGGQRKRLNIALELLREPSILFVDEPTSGLSSRDSENVMDLLRELSFKGKLIFVVIHQPSSDIYKMFDRVMILDTGGYMIYNGNPVQAISYFKRLDHQINPEQSECPSCGNVNPELIFNIIESKIIDEYGQFTATRRVSPQTWHQHYVQHKKEDTAKASDQNPPKGLDLPSKIQQMLIYFGRDLKSKLSNAQYVFINLLEAPLLAFFLSFIVRYISDPSTEDYLFRDNDNIAPYIFMCIIVALFIGLTVSAEEIFRDRKILKREAFLNLSKSSYLISKIGILFILSAIQSFLLVLVGNSILEINDLFFDYWIILFSVFCGANLIGLNISSGFNSAVTIYILIPILIIPQMLLGGAMFSYHKLNKYIGGGYNVPVLAEVMMSRWAYEAMIVRQFKENRFQKYFYQLEKSESEYDYKQSYYAPELNRRINLCRNNILSDNDSVKQVVAKNLALIKNEFLDEIGEEQNFQFKHIDELNIERADQHTLGQARLFVDVLSSYYGKMYDTISRQKEFILYKLQETESKQAKFNAIRNTYSNRFISDLVQNRNATHEVVEQNGRLKRVIGPIYLDPIQLGGAGFSAHFFSPVKYLFHWPVDTFYFNILVLWILNLLLFFSLRFDLLKKTIASFNKEKE